MKNILARGGVEFLAVFLGIGLSLWVDEYKDNKNAEELNYQILNRLYDNLEVKIYSNAIFSLDKFSLGSPALLVFGSKTNHFIGKKAYDLIRFFSLVFENKFKSFVND